MVRPGLDFFSLVFALFKAGVVPVLIDPGIGLRNLGQCCREAAPEVFIGIPKAILAGRLLGWGRETVRRRILVAPGRPCLPGAIAARRRAAARARRSGAADATRRSPADPSPTDEPAAILFTSGSTGPPKGAVYTHGIFNAQVEIIRDLFDDRAGRGRPLHVPALRPVRPALGMTAIVPDMDPTRPARVDPGQDRRGRSTTSA